MTADERQTAAAALRALNDAFVAHDGKVELLERITELAGEVTSELRSAPARDRALRLAEHVGQMFEADAAVRSDAAVRADATGSGMSNPMMDRAVGGPANPISADFEFEYGDGEVVIRTLLGASYGGAPGRAHGGMVAALFDDFAGFLLPLAGTAAYTGELTVRYLRPVPMGSPLEFRLRITGREGRKLRVAGECRAADEVVATTEALFITVDRDQFGVVTE